jgi:tRNA-specific 2-thiouridylase
MLCDRFAGISTPGVFIDENGKELGTHNGIHQYTIGQRRGLGFASGKRMKIINIDPHNGVIVISEAQDAAYFSQCRSTKFNWSREPLPQGATAMAQVRYRQTAVEAIIEKVYGNSLQIKFTTPVFGVSPGQLLVLYKDNCVIGSGEISRH